MFDFIPKISKYRNCLAQLLKNNSPEWNSVHIKAVQQLKRLAKKLPPLQIPGPGKQILQTDASDEYRAVTLFVEIDGKRNICGYKSGALKPSELHYHSTFKEILVLKHGIENFQFHLLGHHFFYVEMDMSFFPKMLQFKRKMLPHPQLFRWSNWFSQWTFQVKHIKGKDNLITDYLSRKPLAINTTIVLPPLYVYPIIDPSSFSGSSSAPPNDILNMIENLPLEIKGQIKILTLEARSKKIIRVLHNYHKEHHNHFLAINPNLDHPWKTPFTLWMTNWTVIHHFYMWYLLNEYYLCLYFEPKFYRFIFSHESRYFQKFQFEILKNDAHGGDWKKYPIIEHPRFGHKITKGCIIAKLNSKKDIQVDGIFHPSETHWVTNLDGTLYLHMDTSQVSYHHALTKVESLNKGILQKKDQATQKISNNSGHMKTFGKCPTFFLDLMTPIMITMTQMLTLMLTKNGTKYLQDLKKKFLETF